MKFRTTENQHLFTRKLFSEINAYSLEGLTMDSNRRFTAAVEAVEFECNEKIDLRNIFNYNELEARYLLANSLGIPFYIVTAKNHEFTIYLITMDDKNNIIYNKELCLDETGFANWWGMIKRTNQTHNLVNGADLRTAKTIFDSIIESTGQAWGGNVDGYIIKNNKIIAIIDNISIGFTDIDNILADPARFFHKKGPKYHTWLSTVKLANELKVPHILLTIDKKNPKNEIVGLAIIDRLDRNGIYYVNNITPPKNIIRNIENIKDTIEKIINTARPPRYI